LPADSTIILTAF
jgi:hypothetical protein